MRELTKLSRLLRTQPGVLSILEQKMNALTGQEGVFDDIIRQHEITVDQTLAGLGVMRHDGPEVIRAALNERLGNLDHHLYTLLGEPNLERADESCAALCSTVKKVFTPPPGLFLKKDRMMPMLEKYPPHSLLEHFGYQSVNELIEKQGLVPVLAALRFTQSTEWMHQFFRISYSHLTLDDFEEREIEMVILPTQWTSVAEKFVMHKHHNVSHLKEFGIIFIVPTKIDSPGETLKLFTLLLHYMHEVPFYSGLFRRHLMEAKDFAEKFISLLRGDVPADPLPDHGKLVWRIVQRYLAKDNADDFRLFEPHVNPEADHWWHAEEDLGRLSRILGKDHGSLDLGWWTGLDYVGEFFTDPKTNKAELVSFDLIDLILTLANNDGKLPFLYHHQEALWNKIFVEYMGREQMEELTAANIFKGFIEL